jgi:hypothetical protein
MLHYHYSIYLYGVKNFTSPYTYVQFFIIKYIHISKTKYVYERQI